MAYAIEACESVEDALKRVALEQTAKVMREIDDSSLDPFSTAHRGRKHCKKLRGLVRLVRPEFGKRYKIENAWYRDAARVVSEMRDDGAMIETYDMLMARFAPQVDRQAFGRIRAALTRDRKGLAEDQAAIAGSLAELRACVETGRDRINEWGLEETGFDAIAGGLQKTYARARSAMKEARNKPTDKKLHEWRKRVKYHWYHMRLVRKMWPTLMRGRRNVTQELAGYLGDDHNLAVLTEVLHKNPAGYAPPDVLEGFLGLINQRRSELQQQAFFLGAKVFAEKPGDFVKRCGKYWKAWMAETDADAASSEPAPEVPDQ